MMTFGRNCYGQLGLGHNKNSNLPQLLKSKQRVCQIACGKFHTIALTDTNDVIVFGCNNYGQILGQNC